MASKWSQPTDKQSANRRAGGRRRYNSQRHWDAKRRRLWVARLLLDSGSWVGHWIKHGALAEIARRLGVSRATICRDVQRLREEARAAGHCPVCGHVFDVSERRQHLDAAPGLRELYAAMPPEPPETAEQAALRRILQDNLPCAPLPCFELLAEQQRRLLDLGDASD